MAEFYTGLSDTNLDGDLQLKQGDIYIAKHERESTAALTAYATGSGNDTITDAGASFTVDGLISTTAKNLLIQDDNGVIAIGKVTDNTATTITFDENDMVLVSDGTTAPTLTVGTTYSYRVLTPSALNEFGELLGYVNEPTWAPEQEIAEFKYSIPRKKKREDLIENIHNINCNIFSTKYTIQKAIFGMTEYGLQTAQVEYHFGSESFNSDFYQIAIVTADVLGKELVWVFWKVKFKPNGEFSFGGEDYKNFPTQFPVFSDSLRDTSGVDFGMYRSKDV